MTDQADHDDQAAAEQLPAGRAGETAAAERVDAALPAVLAALGADTGTDAADPLTRYEALTAAERVAAELPAALRRARGRALADLAAASGATLAEVAERTGLGQYQAVQRLIRAAGLAARRTYAPEEPR